MVRIDWSHGKSPACPTKTPKFETSALLLLPAWTVLSNGAPVAGLEPDRGAGSDVSEDVLCSGHCAVLDGGLIPRSFDDDGISPQWSFIFKVMVLGNISIKALDYMERNSR